MVEQITNSTQETIDFGFRFAQSLTANDVIMLDGDLGAGKTQFTKGVAKALGVSNEIISPTFNILLQYEGTNLELYHFDLYRLDTEEDLEDIGFYETIESGGVSIIEWANKFPACMPEDAICVCISTISEDSRKISINRIKK